jgi:hypothetical protein
MIMASSEQVKEYLAYWFQLGKKILLRNGQEEMLPQTVIVGDRYSSEFELCWQRILDPQSGDCYLEGTHQTIEELLTSKWEITNCARCQMPVPIINLGIQPTCCPCSDLPGWPNTTLPLPRIPINTSDKLNQIKHRLKGNN